MRLFRVNNVFFVLLVFAGLSLVFYACSSGKKTDHNMKSHSEGIYYTNKDASKLIFVKREVNTNGNAQLEAEKLLNRMRDIKKNQRYRSAIPEEVLINYVTVRNNIASVDFSTAYKKITVNEDVICKASIVYTLTQLKGIKYVDFYIDGKSMLDTDGKAIGALNRSSFVFGTLHMNQ